MALGNQPRSFYPYGEQKSGSTATEQYAFATYWRDGESGLDYANQRYYSSTLGRFLSPDPYKASNGGPGEPSDPQSWNRYAYAGNDPVDRYDPTGQFFLTPSPSPCMVDLINSNGDIYNGGFSCTDIDDGLGGLGFTVPSVPQLDVAFAPGTHSLLYVLAGDQAYVNWDNLFDYFAATSVPFPIGVTWPELLAKLKLNPLTMLLALMLMEDGSSGPFQFPKMQCPKGPQFWDPSQSPGKDWEWRGKGPVGSNQGSWYNPVTNESLHPDLGHGDPIGPHWDYTDPTGQTWRCMPDGTFSKSN
jgi:RHS repeat-associated protein